MEISRRPPPNRQRKTRREKTAASNYHGTPRSPANSSSKGGREMRSRFWRKCAPIIKGISRIASSRSAAFYFSFYLFIHRTEISLEKYRGESSRRGRKKEELMKRGVNSHSGNNNGGSRKYNSKRKFNFYWRGRRRKSANRAVRKFRRRIFDFRTNIEQFSCRKKMRRIYWTRIWQQTGIQKF